MTDRDRLAADLHEHWLGHPYVRGEFVFAPCTCGKHVPVPAVPVENRDPVLAFSEHVADRLIALGWTRNMTADDAAYEAGREDGLAEALDEDRLARAELIVGVMPPEITFDEHARRVAKAYREDTDEVECWCPVESPEQPGGGVNPHCPQHGAELPPTLPSGRLRGWRGADR